MIAFAPALIVFIILSSDFPPDAIIGTSGNFLRISATTSSISFPRYSNQTINALSFAKSRGATIISITDGEMSPIAQYATYLLVAESSMVSFVDSLVAPLSLINALIAACAKENDGHVCENLGELEKIWDKYHVYRTDKEEQE